MSGEGNPGVEPGGAVALQQRTYGDTKQQPRIEREHQGRQETERGAVGLGRGLHHRIGILTLILGTSALQVLWVILLGWVTLWLWQALPV